MTNSTVIEKSGYAQAIGESVSTVENWIVHYWERWVDQIRNNPIVPGIKIQRESPCQLYRHFNQFDELLYVGISLSVMTRLSQHRASPWFADVVSVDIEHFPSRAEAEEAETRAIKVEKPAHNVIHNR